jgi:hypothetical protein
MDFERLLLRTAAPAVDKTRQRFTEVRSTSVGLVENLSDGDATAQSMADASPAKWHLAHTTWFFESFVLSEYVPDYRPFDTRFPTLFNSYYEAKGARIARSARGASPVPPCRRSWNFASMLMRRLRSRSIACSPWCET